jgi:hypothetical protein
LPAVKTSTKPQSPLLMNKNTEFHSPDNGVVDRWLTAIDPSQKTMAPLFEINF